jgi:hypothetical protein
MRLPGSLARANPRGARHDDGGAGDWADECERAVDGDCGAAGLSG